MENILQNRVLFDNNYFKKTIREYKDYLFAFFRETGQNSIDAGSKNVNYFIEEKDEYYEIVCSDDGFGMTRDILLNKFLVMGGTHKQDENSVGGFGYAKSIILFCHDYYKVETNDLFIVGSYGSFSDVKQSENVKGTKITIHLEKSNSDINNLKAKLKQWVSNCELPNVKIRLNNKELVQANNNFEYNQKITIGDLKFEENKDYQAVLWVRLRGMAMFEKEIYIGNDDAFKGYLDLNSKSSLDCLTSNRDGLLRTHDRELSRLIQELVNERSKYKLTSMNGFMLNKENDFSNNDKNSTICSNENINETFAKLTGHIKLLESNKNNLDLFKEKRLLLESFKEKLQKRINKISSDNYPSNFLVKINSEKEESLEQLKYYTKITNLMNQQRTIKLANTFEKLVNKTCDILIKNEEYGFDVKEKEVYLNGEYVLVKDYCYYDKPIKVGFCFDNKDSIRGLNVENNEFIHININPELTFNDKYNKDDILFLIIHELAHCVYKNHSDSHSALMFEYNQLVSKNKKVFMKI